MVHTDYTYAVARVRSRETLLLDDAFYEQLLSNDYQGCLRLLSEKGWGDQNTDPKCSNMLAIERQKLWSFMHELVSDDSVFDVFTVPNDFHNLKVSVKAFTRKADTDGMFIDNGTVSFSTIYDAVSKQEYDSLPSYLQQPAKNAMSALLTTSDGQLCDVIIDKACLEYIYGLSKSGTDDVIKKYAELYVASSDIKIAVRCAKTSKTRDFALSAMADCDTLNIDKLSYASADSVESVLDYLQETVYKSAVEHISASMSSFEKWCDDLLTKQLENLKWDPFSFGALVGYIVARENEIKSVRMILAGKLNNLDDQVIRERLRKTYV